MDQRVGLAGDDRGLDGVESKAKAAAAKTAERPAGLFLQKLAERTSEPGEKTSQGQRIRAAKAALAAVAAMASDGHGQGHWDGQGQDLDVAARGRRRGRSVGLAYGRGSGRVVAVADGLNGLGVGAAGSEGAAAGGRAEAAVVAGLVSRDEGSEADKKHGFLERRATFVNTANSA